MIINLTPHDLTIFDPEGSKEVARIPSQGLARVVTEAEAVGSVSVDGVVIPIVETTYGQVEGLPEAQTDTVYVASILVIQALRALEQDRSDVVAPDTGPESVVRDDGGRIRGVRRFTR